MNANKKNKKAEEVDVPLKEFEGTKKEAFTDEQFGHVPLIQLKTLISKIPKKGLANRVPRKRRAKFPELENIQSTVENLLQQVTPGEGLEVVKDLIVDDDVEVGREVNFKAISSEYGGDLLEKGDEKDNDDKKDVEENVKSEEEQPQVVEEDDSEPPTVVVYYNGKKDVQHANETMVVAEVAKTDIVFFNQEEVVGEAYQVSGDQTTDGSVEEQTLEVEKTKDEVSQSKESKKEVEQNKEVVVEGKDDDDGNSQNKPGPEQLILMKSEVDVTLKKRQALIEEEINERAFKMACRINQLSLRKDKLSPEAKKDNRSTYMSIGEETIYLNVLYTLYPKQWLDNEVIDVYIKDLIQYFNTQHRARLDKERIVLADAFAC
ncbi:hypothetical protein GIB67_019730 [Kingdonia uniflora]|uniref:Uncharacterized protein n=1 Tax=Kingdonia uniflora TaxID=39325 RepID=A0A7J7MK83_9MAGN|nr:hypothetical protein GIB67_019730 [Kingdonia uniflora]